MKLTKKIEAMADRKIKYLSNEYLKLGKMIQRFAEVHILYNGFYSYTEIDGSKKTRVLITR